MLDDCETWGALNAKRTIPRLSLSPVHAQRQADARKGYAAPTEELSDSSASCLFSEEKRSQLDTAELVGRVKSQVLKELFHGLRAELVKEVASIVGSSRETAALDYAEFALDTKLVSLHIDEIARQQSDLRTQVQALESRVAAQEFERAKSDERFAQALHSVRENVHSLGQDLPFVADATTRQALVEDQRRGSKTTQIGTLPAEHRSETHIPTGGVPWRPTRSCTVVPTLCPHEEEVVLSQTDALMVVQRPPQEQRPPSGARGCLAEVRPSRGNVLSSWGGSAGMATALSV